MTRTIIKYLSLFFAVIIATVLARLFILGNAAPVILANGSYLGGVVSQAFVANSSTPLPKAGVDFTINNTHYFENKNWVILNFQPVKNNFDPGIVVLKLVNGGYQRVLGPANSFSDTVTDSMPYAAGQYLKGLGVLHG